MAVTPRALTAQCTSNLSRSAGHTNDVGHGCKRSHCLQARLQCKQQRARRASPDYSGAERSKLRKDYPSSFIQNVLWLTGTFPFRRSHTMSQSLLAASPVLRNWDGKAAFGMTSSSNPNSLLWLGEEKAKRGVRGTSGGPA